MTCPSVGSLVPGPMEPSTQRGRSGLGHRVHGLAGDPRPGLGQLGDPVGDAVLAEVGEVRAERVGRHAVRTGGQVRVVDRAHDVRARYVQDLVAALVALEVVQHGVAGLQHGAHGAVRDQHPAGQRRPQGTTPELFAVVWRSVSRSSVSGAFTVPSVRIGGCRMILKSNRADRRYAIPRCAMQRPTRSGVGADAACSSADHVGWDARQRSVTVRVVPGVTGPMSLAQPNTAGVDWRTRPARRACTGRRGQTSSSIVWASSPHPSRSPPSKAGTTPGRPRAA